MQLRLGVSGAVGGWQVGDEDAVDGPAGSVGVGDGEVLEAGVPNGGRR